MMLDVGSAITGKPLASAVSAALGYPLPRSKAKMMRALIDLGGMQGAVESVARLAGFPEIDIEMAATGDWGISAPLQAGGRDVLEGVIRAPDAWIYRIPDVGVRSVPQEYAAPTILRAWAVG